MTINGHTEPLANGKRVLVVEDEILVGMLLEDMLNELGHEHIYVVPRLSEAVQAASDSEFAFAILDVNIDGDEIFPVADILKAKGTPFIFATGYGTRGLPDHYRDRPTLQKPFSMKDLKRVLERIED